MTRWPFASDRVCLYTSSQPVCLQIRLLRIPLSHGSPALHHWAQWRKCLAKTLSLSTENSFRRKNFTDILVYWIRRLGNCRASAHMHNYQKQVLKSTDYESTDVHLMEMYLQIPEKNSFESTYIFCISECVQTWLNLRDFWNINLFHFSSPIFKLPIKFHHQCSAAGTDMAKTHWFILKGGMFTEIQPDSVKAEHKLQHENPTPSSKTPL